MIAIATSSMRFYYGIVEELRKRDLEFLSLKVGEDVPPRVDVVLTTPEEKPLIDFPRIVADVDLSLAAEEAARIARGFKEKHGKIIIGIDPGRRPGIAVIAENRAVDSFIAPSPGDVKGMINKVMRVHLPREVVVRIGSGGGIYGMQILKHLEEIKDITVEIVDEHSTSRNTSQGGFQSHSDADAALNIALKKGRPLETKVRMRIKPGEIKNIQNDSRAASGDLTISKDLARKVAKGELNLEEAIMKHRKKRKEGGA
jgi:hypothetical protein